MEICWIIKRSHLHVFTDERDLSAAGKMARVGFDASPWPHWLSASFYGEWKFYANYCWSKPYVFIPLNKFCLLLNAINNFSFRNSFVSTQTYTIRGLENNSVYEAIVQAKVCSLRIIFNELQGAFLWCVMLTSNENLRVCVRQKPLDNILLCFYPNCLDFSLRH